MLGARALGEFGDDPDRYTSAKSRRLRRHVARHHASGRKHAVVDEVALRASVALRALRLVLHLRDVPVGDLGGPAGSMVRPSPGTLLVDLGLGQDS